MGGGKSLKILQNLQLISPLIPPPRATANLEFETKLISVNVDGNVARFVSVT